MGEWLKKNGGNIVLGGMVAGWFAMVGGAIASLVKGEKRQKAYYQQLTEIQDEQITYWKNLNGKES